MNHDEAIRLKAAEKYLLGELSAEMRDQYEDHYFGCAECAQDIRTGAVFIDNTRDMFSADSFTECGSEASACPFRRLVDDPAAASIRDSSASATSACCRISECRDDSAFEGGSIAVRHGSDPAVVFADLREFAWRRSARCCGSRWQAFQLFCGHSANRRVHLLRLRISIRIWNARIVAERLRGRSEANRSIIDSCRTPGIGKARACRARIGLARKARCG